MMLGIMMAMDYSTYLEGQRNKCEKAIDLGKKQCARCGFCCLQRPCLPTPNEIKKIAKFLKLTPKEAIKRYFVIDAFEAGDTKFAFPAKHSQKDITGTYIPYERTYDRGYCIFFNVKERACQIYSVRPKQAQIMKCWNESENAWEKQRDETLKKWADFNWEEFGINVNEIEEDE